MDANLIFLVCLCEEEMQTQIHLEGRSEKEK